MRVLILADDCNPEWPSLPVVGYKAARAIAEVTEAVVVTHVRNKPNIDRAGFGRARVAYVDNEYVARPLHRISTLLRGGSATAWTTAVAMGYPSYLAFEREVWKRFAGEIRGGAFDVVHRLTPMSPTIPSPMATWSPVPFVLGPLNGGLAWPAEFRAELVKEREWLSYLRPAYRTLPYSRSTFAKAAAILAGFAHTLNDLPPSQMHKAIDFPEVGFDGNVFAAPPERAPGGRRTILFVGRFVPYKLPGMVIEAFAARPSLRAEHRLVMVGDGPERGAMEALVARHGLDGCVEFVGWRNQAEVATFMRAADIFAFPSIRELGAGVLVEAMASGLACVVVDYGAPGALVGAGRGLKVPLRDRTRMTNDLADALVALTRDEVGLRAIQAEARRYAFANYEWGVRAARMLAVYESVAGRRGQALSA